MLGAGLVATALYAVDWRVALLLISLLGYETWTFFNPYQQDTISEEVWRISERPLVPHLFGIYVGIALHAEVFGPMKEAILCYSAAFLMGHFFFQQQDAYRRIRKAKDDEAL